MARTGLRTIPTFPSSPLRFRTAGFPQYGSKAGLSGAAFPACPSVRPAPGTPFAQVGLHASFVRPAAVAGNPAQSQVRGSATHHHSSSLRRSSPGALAPVRVLLSRSIITYSAPSAPLAGTSRLPDKAGYTRRLRCAGAPRRPASGSVLSLFGLSRHAVLYVPGEPVGCLFPILSSPTASAFATIR